jgi:hypothetical protein
MKTRVPAPLPQYLEFLSPYGPAITELALATRRLVLERAPGASELIYDAYNAVASGYSFTGRPSDSFIHIAVYPKWVNLGFNFGSQLPDPEGILKGSGQWVRHVRISSTSDLEKQEIDALVTAAIERADRPAALPSNTESVLRAIYPNRRRPKPTQQPRSK